MGLLDKKASDSSSSSSSSSSQGLRRTPSPPREETPLLGEANNPLSSQPKSLANVFIAIVGAGVLGLPYTFMKTGWLTGLLTITAVAALTGHCMMLLVLTRRKLDSFTTTSTNNNNKLTAKINSFGDLGFAVCGSLGRFAVDAMIILSQSGFCIGYLIFIGTSLANLFNPSSSSTASNNLSPTLRRSANIWGMNAQSFYIWSCLPFQLGLNAIPTLTHLAPLSIFADIVQIGAMGVVISVDISTFSKQRPAVEPFGSLSAFFYGLGVAVFSFEGVGMVLPLESEMKKKNKFGKILGITMVFIALLYGLFGDLGYFAFGEDTADIITANLGDGLLSALVQLGLSINLFFTFPLMMHPVYEVMERRFSEGRYCLWIRWLLVLVVSLVALFVPNFTDFLSLVGSSICCTLSFVLPALFHYLVFKNEMDWKGMFADLGIIVVGALVGVFGTWSSLSEIIS